MLGAEVRRKFLVALPFVSLFYFGQGVAERYAGRIELPRTFRAGPAQETLSLNPHHFGACRKGLTAGRSYHCAIWRLLWRRCASVPVKREIPRMCTQADTLPKDGRRLRVQRCACHWQNLQSTRKSSGALLFSRVWRPTAGLCSVRAAAHFGRRAGFFVVGVRGPFGWPADRPEVCAYSVRSLQPQCESNLIRLLAKLPRAIPTRTL